MKQLTSLAIAALVAVTLAGCSKDAPGKTDSPAGQGPGKGGKQKMAFPVEVRPVESRLVEYTVPAVGSVDAFEIVEVTARVAGAVDRVLFREGQSVTAGTTLVEIDPDRYRLAVASAEANLSRAKAGLSESVAGFERRQTASAKNPGLIRGEEIETWRTKVESSKAEVAQAQAALQQANLNLRDALVRAPLAGTIQTRTVQTGQYVQAGSVLATLVRRDPLLLRFQVPEQESTRVHPGMVANFTLSDDQMLYQAKISHVAEAADQASRMVAVTALIEHPNRPALRPGAFARITIPVGSTLNAPVVPQTAIRPSEKGFLAYVVEGGVARERILGLGMRTEDGSVEVRNGLKAGDNLVVRGAEALSDGAPVKVQKSGA